MHARATRFAVALFALIVIGVSAFNKSSSTADAAARADSPRAAAIPSAR